MLPPTRISFISQVYSALSVLMFPFTAGHPSLLYRPECD